MAKSVKLPYPYMVSMPESLADVVTKICDDNAIDRSTFILRALKLMVEYYAIPDFSIPDFNFDEQEDVMRRREVRIRREEEKKAKCATQQAPYMSPLSGDDDEEQVLLAAEED